jgi:hypothetical protein
MDLVILSANFRTSDHSVPILEDLIMSRETHRKGVPKQTLRKSYQKRTSPLAVPELYEGWLQFYRRLWSRASPRAVQGLILFSLSGRECFEGDCSTYSAMVKGAVCSNK